MATITAKRSSQGLDTKLIAVTANEAVVVSLTPPTKSGVRGAVNWDRGGLSWSIVPQTAGQSINCAVHYSLFLEGDEDWVPHVSSPFTAPKQENEFGRCDRVRFTNASGSNPVYVTVSSNSLFQVS